MPRSPKRKRADRPRAATRVAPRILRQTEARSYARAGGCDARRGRLPPALTILSQVVLGVLVGALGIVLASP